MGMRRAKHQAAQGGLGRVIVGVAALAADQRVVLLAQNALATPNLMGAAIFIFPSYGCFAGILARKSGSANGFSHADWPQGRKMHRADVMAELRPTRP